VRNKSIASKCISANAKANAKAFQQMQKCKCKSALSVREIEAKSGSKLMSVRVIIISDLMKIRTLETFKMNVRATNTPLKCVFKEV